MQKENLLLKYNVSVPRYTSYPPANYFTSNITSPQYEKAIIDSNTGTPEHISFYIHIPFCRHLCHYCGCNSIAVMQPEVVDKYVECLHKEIDMVIEKLDKSRKISQIHYGGGSPTLLPAEILRSLNEHLLSSFSLIENPEIAIECHPGYLDEKDWEALTNAGFNRFSLGVQDLNPEVLKIVNRRPSLLPLGDIFEILRSASARINLDLLYGLPLQTVESFTETVEKAIELSPDRLVTFSYGHVPWVSPRQRILEKSGFPSGEEKKQMFETAKSRLVINGYETIGLDHFVKKSDELYFSLQNNLLSRNFQGYCSKRTTGQVYAFGVTGISQLSTAYMQNTKDVLTYIDRIEKGVFSVERGYLLNRKEQVTKEAITTLMCNYRLDVAQIGELFCLSVDEVKDCLVWNEEKLQAFVRDGIIRYTDRVIEITPEGALFVRNVAASLDKLMLQTSKSYSKPV